MEVVGSPSRNAAYGAFLFAAGLAANVVVFTRNFDTAEEVANYLADGAVVGRLGLISIGLAGVGLIVLVAGYRTRLAPEREWLGSLAFGSGILAVSMMWVRSTVDIGITDTVGGEVDYALYQVLRGLAHFQGVLMVFAFLLMLGSIYASSRDGKSLPKWASLWTLVTVVLIGVLLLFTASVLLLVPWAIAIGVALLRETPATA